MVGISKMGVCACIGSTSTRLIIREQCKTLCTIIMLYWDLSDEYLSFAAQSYAKQLRLCTNTNSSASMRFVFDSLHKKDIETFKYIIVPQIRSCLAKDHKVALEQNPNSHHFLIFWVRAYKLEN